VAENTDTLLYIYSFITCIIPFLNLTLITPCTLTNQVQMHKTYLTGTTKKACQHSKLLSKKVFFIFNMQSMLQYFSNLTISSSFLLR